MKNKVIAIMPGTIKSIIYQPLHPVSPPPARKHHEREEDSKAESDKSHPGRLRVGGAGGGGGEECAAEEVPEIFIRCNERRRASRTSSDTF